MSTKSALLFDDDPGCRNLYTLVLEAKGYKVTTFSDPLLFLQQIETAVCPCSANAPCVDVILTDNNMPGMTGLEFLAQLGKMSCKVSNQRKAVISGHWPEEQVAQAEQLNCKVFQKPTPLKDINAWLDE